MANKISGQSTYKKLANNLLVFVMLFATFIVGIWAEKIWTEAKSKNGSYFSIEQSNVRVFPYIGKDKSDLAPNETVIFQIVSYEERGRIINRYMLDYWLDSQQPSQVGFVFAFNKPLDLSRFSHIRLKCFLNAPSIRIQVASNLKDDRIQISKGNYGLTEIAGEQEISIPFSAFAETDWKNISALNFKVDADTTFKVASKRFAVEKIEFVK